MEGFPVTPAGRHPCAQPALGIPDRLGIERGRCGFVDASMPRERGGGGQEPGFVLGLGQHNTNGTIRPAVLGEPQQAGSELRRTVVVRVQKHQNAPVRPGSTGCQRDRALHLFGFHNLVPLDSDRSGNFQRDTRGQVFGDSPEQDGNRLYFTVAFDDCRNPVHASEPGAEEVELACLQSRTDGVRLELIHSEKLACGVEMVPQSRTSNIVKWTDTGLAVLGDHRKD